MRESGSDGEGGPVLKDRDHQWEPEFPNPPSKPFPVTSFLPPFGKSQMKSHTSYKKPSQLSPNSAMTMTVTVKTRRAAR